MACNNGKKGLHSPYGMITDLNITYTGCSTTCNGEEIKPGMRLREILDILIGDCAEGGSVTWGDIIGNIEDQTDLVQFIQDNISVANWGSILGDIEDQQDLVDYVAANGFGEDKVGTNLHLDEDGKLNVGVDPTPLGIEGTIITSDGNLDSGNLNPFIILSETLGGINVNTTGGNLTHTTGGGNLSQSTGGGNLIQTTGGGNISISAGAGDISVFRGDSGGLRVLGSGGTQLSSSGADTRVSAFNGNVVISPGTTGGGYYALIGANSIQDSNRPVNANTSVVLGPSAEVSGFNNLDGGVTFDFYNRASSPANRVGVRHIYRRYSSNNRAVVLQLYKEGTHVDHSTFIEYDSGMPEEVFISDNVLPTIGYVRDTLISDAITAAITPLLQQISDLEARVQALEDATP